MMNLPPNPQVARAQPSQTATRQATGSTISKLRDSCHACALSKVKCHKEKPTCLRCARRGMTCEYFITKRPGRKRENSLSTKIDSNGDTINVARRNSTSWQGSWPGSTGSSAYATPPDLSPTFPRSGTVSRAEHFSSDIFSDPLISLESSLSFALAGMSSEFDELYATPIDFFELDALDPINFTQECNDTAKLLVSNDIDLDPVLELPSLDSPQASKPSSPSTDSRSRSAGYTSVTGALESTCSCLMQALELMKKLSSTNPLGCVTSKSPNNATIASNMSHSGNSSAQAVVMENKQTIEAISNILHCSCADDTYLQTILSMTIFKMLERYAAAAQRQPRKATGGHNRPIRNTSTEEQIRQFSSSAEEEDLRRKAAQLILSELHHVQRLVNQLSSRLKTRGVGRANKSREGADAEDGSGNCQMSSFSEGETMKAPFSAITLDQIEVDLRKCLSTLSSEIISRLRQT